MKNVMVYTLPAYSTIIDVKMQVFFTSLDFSLILSLTFGIITTKGD